MARKVIGPVTGEATLALGSKGAAQETHDALAAGRGLIGHFVRPEREQAQQFAGMLLDLR